MNYRIKATCDLLFVNLGFSLRYEFKFMKAQNKLFTPFIWNILLDVNSWLVTFGFHLHNAIPGFPVPKFDLTEPSYELVKSQQWDDIPVRNNKQNYEKLINGLLVSCLPIFNHTTL